MAGYSQAPLASKLGVRGDSTLVLLGAPPAFSIELPPGAVLRRGSRGAADVIVSFHTRAATLERSIAGLGRRVFPHGAVWIAWPKKASGVATDLTDRVVREAALAAGLVDNKVCAIDEVWSGLRLVWPREHRGSPRPSRSHRPGPE